MSFLQLPEEIHFEILSYLSPFHELFHKTIDKKQFNELKIYIPIIMKLRLIQHHSNIIYSNLISKLVDEFISTLFYKIFENLNSSSKQLDFKTIFDKIGIVKSFSLFIHHIRKRERNEKINFYRKSELPIVILLLGEVYSGKTSIINQIMYGKFKVSPNLLNYYRKKVVIDQKESNLLFIDSYEVNGRFIPEKDRYYRERIDFDILVIVCSMNENESLQKLKQILSKFVNHKGIDSPCIIVLNKNDVEYKFVNVEEVLQIIQEFKLTNCKMLKTSAKTGENINHLVEECVRKFRERVVDLYEELDKFLLDHEQREKINYKIEYYYYLIAILFAFLSLICYILMNNRM